MKFMPHQYQEFAIQKTIDTLAIGLFLGMGLGKTVITLTALDLMKNLYFDADKILVIAPLRVAQDTWSRESKKWDHLQHLTISKILGTRAQREKALKVDADIYVINRENVPWLVNMVGSDWDFDTVVIDELSSFKSSKSKRFRALRRVRPLINRIIGLTGTPAPNGLHDLWAQLYLLDQGERLGKTITGYRDRYFIPGRSNGHVVYEWKQKKEAESRVYEQISDICVSMSAEDWLDLPERIERTVAIPMSPDSKAKYKKLEKDLLLEFEDSDVTADTAAVLSNKLLQLANGAIYDENRDVQHVHDAKLDALEDLIEAANGNPILCFYTYKHDLSRIQERFPSAVKLESTEDIAKWNKGEIPLLLTHPASAGHGLNLQDGGHNVVWFGLTWSLELYQQANARLDRQGQTERVVVHHLVSEGTLDETVIQRLADKTAGQDALLDAVKARIERVKKEG